MASREITTLSSAEERTLAAEQLRAAQIEYKNTLDAWPTDTEGYRIVPSTGVRLTLNDYENIASNIAAKYDYVDYGNFNQSSNDSGTLTVNVGGSQFFVKGYGNNAEFETTKDVTAVNRDDAYVAPSSPGPSPIQQDAGRNTARADQAGSSVTDAPGLSNAQTTPAGSPTSTTDGNRSSATDSAAGPSNPANTTPVTQNGDAADVGADPAAGQAGSRGDRLPTEGNDSATGSAAAARDDDAGGTGENTGNSTGDAQDGSNNGTNNTGVSVGQAGQGTQLGDPSKGGTKQNKRILQRSNPLHEYVNWTYQVGWYMLDIPTFNSFVNSNTDSPSLRKKPIMKTGGFAKTGQGLDYDLGLVSLEIENVIGNNTDSPGSNIYSINMQVMEPYGVSLIGALKQLAGDNDDPFQIPYLLEIKWLGYDDNGKLVNNIPNTGPKLLPVKIINITFKIDSAGTVYNISMVPYTQNPIDKREGVLRQDINLYGDSLQTLLKEGPDSLKEFLKKKAEADVADGNAQYADEYDFEILSFDPGTRAPNNKLATAGVTFPQKGGEGTVLKNRGMGNPADRAAGVAGTPGLAASLLTTPNSALSGFGTGGSPGFNKTNDPTKQYFSYRGGTTIVALIVDLAKNSKYFQDEITDKPNSEKNKPLQLVKVIPMVSELKNYDNIRKVYQKKIIYKVIPYFEYGRLYPYAGQAGIENRGFVKEYNWLFTGKNEDIVDLRLDYKFTYFQVFSKSQTAKSALNVAANVEEKPTAKNPLPLSENALVPGVASGPGSSDPKGFRPESVAEYFDMALNNPKKADLVRLELDIIGDPDWITQDRSVRPKGTDINATNSGFVDNDPKMGIAVDVDAVYAKLNFRTPRDYDDKTGLMNLTLEQTLISGVYKVYRVTNKFDGGRFMQTLQMARAESQPENKPNSQAAMANARQQDRASVPGYSTTPNQSNLVNTRLNVATETNATAPRAPRGSERF